MSRLTEVLEELRAAGVTRAAVQFDARERVKALDVQFASAPVPVAATPFVDKSGKPVNLDAGLPLLAQDPDAPPAPVEESSDAALEHANFRKKEPARAS
jgi:hypothetical protein